MREVTARSVAAGPGNAAADAEPHRSSCSRRVVPMTADERKVAVQALAVLLQSWSDIQNGVS
jgi:hypothetical protein